ncbi:HlyD family type I secretion periplasmic adaptor subunit [Ancylobacter sp. SL191]|uniref:HlyD family type I secretion periplasmic adaptor subunit n=1 Tax=Ancylobacter sp. SL191 TaxID=2995166 RepID=UPI00227090A3|nr:HlyD family type I secretion periplasmic adaptor subunit [Ancylobacter sp. SL191]WAC29596.1 HlyD family type I secretion periplasmic adaptor subunit [Ancylobacter sp. SL191]
MGIRPAKSSAGAPPRPSALREAWRKRVQRRRQRDGADRRRTKDDPADPSRHLRFGAMVCAGVVLSFSAWSALASLQSAVVSSGIVVTEGKTRTVQHLDGGIISALAVRDGAEVKAGDLLIRLDATRHAAERAIIENRLYEALARQARLKAERDDAPAMTRPAMLDVMVGGDRAWANLLPTYPATTAVLVGTGLPPEAITPPETGAEIANRVFSGQERLFQARRDTVKAQIARLEAGIAQSREQIGGLEAQREAARRQHVLIGKELETARVLGAKGLMPSTRLLALERQQAELEGAIAGRGADKAAIEQGIGQLHLQILELERDTREKVLTELREADANVQELLEQRIAAIDKLSRTDVRAPVSGRVNALAFHTLGGVVKPGDVMMEIVPDDETLIVEARADPASVDRIRAGQPARIRLAAFDQHSTPELAGTLLVVSPDRLVDPQTGASYFALKVAIDTGQLDLLGPDKPLVPGMPADVFIVTGRRTPLSYLTKPLTDQMARAFRED